MGRWVSVGSGCVYLVEGIDRCGMLLGREPRNIARAGICSSLDVLDIAARKAVERNRE